MLRPKYDDPSLLHRPYAVLQAGGTMEQAKAMLDAEELTHAYALALMNDRKGAVALMLRADTARAEIVAELQRCGVQWEAELQNPNRK